MLFIYLFWWEPIVVYISKKHPSKHKCWGAFFRWQKRLLIITNSTTFTSLLDFTYQHIFGHLNQHLRLFSVVLSLSLSLLCKNCVYVEKFQKKNKIPSKKEKKGYVWQDCCLTRFLESVYRVRTWPNCSNHNDNVIPYNRHVSVHQWSFQFASSCRSNESGS